MTRTDDLGFAIYTRHGDCCNCHLYAQRNHNDCGSGYSPDDYVLSAAFAYLQEALDVIQRWNTRGVSCKLRSKNYSAKPRFNWSDYPAKREAA